MAADLPDPAPVWRLQTAHSYLTNHRGTGLVTSVVYSKLDGREMTTRVEDGPLAGQGETLQTDPSLNALRAQHVKWVWRVVNADVTHADWFRARRKKRPPAP